ncbi:hypothetical protein FIBSPDRAFT_802773 [Athelia psychrophila]|uniref:Uncharacterized protein n=1 Tax=Athelia psychrophila TaxID=1759441 RepID=A0A165XLU2_9AGAM|nr:hypothetical protein FIBSPDRAFT_802773 [Fibularhizoctonia sp. CBS 109695]
MAIHNPEVEGNILREVRPADSKIVPLDSSLLDLSDEEGEFLKWAISPDESVVKEMILRTQADELFPYPCIQLFHFVSLKMMRNAVYQKVLEVGKTGETVFLDIGCCMGTDLRKLVYDGYPVSRVLGCDLRPEFITAGYDLYQDKASSKIHFFASDVFDIPVNAPERSIDIPLANVNHLSDLTNKITHLYSGALYHLFDEATQYAIAVRMATLIRRTTGSVIFGRHQGLEPEGMIADAMARVRYGHSPASWKRLWHRVFIELEGIQFAEERVKIDAEFAESVQYGNMNARMMYWSVSIL